MQIHAIVFRSAVGGIKYHLANKNFLLWIGPLYHYNSHYQLWDKHHVTITFQQGMFLDFQ